MRPQSDFAYMYSPGTYRETEFQIGVRADPDINEPDSFAAVLFFEMGDGSRVEVAKVDNSEHEKGGVHIDRFYRGEGADLKDFSIDARDVWEADEYLKERWLHFARSYLDNHGKRPREG